MLCQLAVAWLCMSLSILEYGLSKPYYLGCRSVYQSCSGLLSEASGVF